MAKTNICERALKVALLCVIALASAIAADNTISDRWQHPPPPRGGSFGSFSSGPYRGPPRYETSPPPPHYAISSSGPYRGPPRYETSPPPPHHALSSSGPYHGPPLYERSPPPPPHPRRLRSSYGSFYSGPYHGPPLYEIPPPPHAV
ncbi:unnamed protein product [Sphenostylis stenocarpa]|uniref:Uncharacterized protein n=1 Tax=Sphenostylis stenocarpa TaxID=92480 RepID=A0AA86SMW6_9FABA|nr:unnamed protein product [Sphenostylis stenocarpa]